MEAERAKGFQIALQRHHVEAPAELGPCRRRRRVDAASREEIVDQLVDLGLGQVDVGIAQERHQIVGVGTQPGVLKIDDVEPTGQHHQISAVVIAMAQHARFCRQLDGQSMKFSRQCLVGRLGEAGPAIGPHVVLHEEIELPRELLPVEGSAIRQIRVRRQIPAATLHQADERDGLPVEIRVLGRRGRAEMRLEGDVSEILQHQDAQIAGVSEDPRDWQRDLVEQRCHVHEREPVVREGFRVQRKDGGRPVAVNHAKVAAVGCVAGERHHARLGGGQPGALEETLDPFASAGGI